MATIADFLGFDPNQTESVNSMGDRPDPVPEGKYKVCATTLKRKETNKKDGWYWYAEFTILGGDYDGRKVEHRFNIRNPNETAERIGQGQMKRFLDVIGVPQPQNEDDMLNVPLMASIKVKKNTYDKNGEKVSYLTNEIDSLDPYETTMASPPAQQQQPAQSQADVADDAPPWAKQAAA